MRLALLSTLLIALTVAGAGQGRAEVRFGRNVFIGGHDFSHQTFNARRRAVVHLYDRAPRREGCVRRADGRGGSVKTCHLRRLPRR